MKYWDLLKRTEHFVRTFVQEHRNVNIIYHGLIHTENVVNAAIKISDHYKLSEAERFICIAAAWFHDIGYYEDKLRHEEIGASKAEKFLSAHGVDEEIRLAIINCILATKLPQRPTNLLEEIICDADVYHFGTDDFQFQDHLVRQETALLDQAVVDLEQWNKATISLLEGHQYHTRYCKELLNNKKEQNLEWLRNGKSTDV